MYGECYWSWYFCVVINNVFCIWKIVLHWNSIRINILEIIHANLKSSVNNKHLQLCIFMRNFWFFVSVLLFITFWSFACNKIQHILPPIFDNSYFYLSISLSIRILDALNRLTSKYLLRGVISGIIFCPIPNKDCSFLFIC